VERESKRRENPFQVLVAANLKNHERVFELAGDFHLRSLIRLQA